MSVAGGASAYLKIEINLINFGHKIKPDFGSDFWGGEILGIIFLSSFGDTFFISDFLHVYGEYQIFSGLTKIALIKVKALVLGISRNEQPWSIVMKLVYGSSGALILCLPPQQLQRKEIFQD